jgi:hypothetical protein
VDGGTSVPGGVFLGPVFVAGREARVQLAPFTRFGCEGGLILPDTFEVTVSDPDNLEVPAEARLETSPGAMGLLTVVFRPEAPGVYHVLARFDPVGGIQQASVMVAEDHLRPPDVTLARSCGTLHRTAAGRLLCDGHPVAADGTVPEEPFFSAVAVHGDEVWRLTAGRLSLAVDEAGEELSPRGEGMLTSSVQALAAGESFVALLMEGRLWTARVTPEGEFALQEGPPLASGTAGLRLVVAGARVYALESTTTVDSSGMSVLSTRACAYAVSPEAPARAEGGCQSLPGYLYGLETGGVWTELPTPFRAGSTVRLFQAGEAGLEETARLISPTLLGLAFPDSRSGFLVNGQPLLVPRAEGHTLVVEHYGTQTEGEALSGARFVAHTSGEGTRVWLRD